MLDLIVIGGGFWGTACAVMAESLGLSVVLVDDLNPQGASRNAAGIVSLGWYRWRMKRDQKDVIGNIFSETFVPQDANFGAGWLRDRGLLRQTGEEFFTLAGNQHFREDIWLLSSPQEFFE